ncbi:MAG: AraC family transcriptional regulator [Bacillota bacterium]|nr:AraC family transcriptional regulator [Bacillota bacterium]
MDIKKEWSYKEFLMRENNIKHAPYNPEFAFYAAVKSGDVKKVTNFCKGDFTDKKGLGKLSDDPLRNVIYHFIITVALVARYCIEGGMEHEVAYSLSDFYIQKSDKCTTLDQISQLHSIMTIDYTKRMNALKKDKIYSKPIVQCIDYIYDNLNVRITVAILADCVKLNPSYLSCLFKKETGISISMYIQNRKIETAMNMLKYSNYPTSHISSILAFPTQSYFIEVFKKQVGVTPKKYRELCFRETAIFAANADKNKH